MGDPKTETSKRGEKMHYSVGALIKISNKYLMIDRAKPPFGFAGLAGHIDEGEQPIEALLREVEEESGLKVEDYKLLFEEILDWNGCSRGIRTHYWFLFECDVSGDIKRNYAETKSIGLYTKEEINKLKLEPVWEYWFKKMEII